MEPVIPVKVYVDAACFKQNRNGVPIGIGVYVLIGGKPAPQYNLAKFVGQGNNMIGEWIGLVYGFSQAYKIMQHYRAKGKRNLFITLYCDNQPVVRCFNDAYRTKPEYELYKRKAKEYHDKIADYFNAVLWISRDFNQEADRLSKKALEHLDSLKQ